MSHDEKNPIVDKIKLQFNVLVKDLADDAGGKFVLKSPGYLDYAYLAYDIVNPIGGYLGYVGKEPLTLEELCKQLIGAGTGFAGSVGGASVGSYIGTLIMPGLGTFIGGLVGSNIAYSYGKGLVIGETSHASCHSSPRCGSIMINPCCDDWSLHSLSTSRCSTNPRSASRSSRSSHRSPRSPRSLRSLRSLRNLRNLRSTSRRSTNPRSASRSTSRRSSPRSTRNSSSPPQ